MADGTAEGGRIPSSVYESQSWQIHAIVPDFELEDVWALPATGGPDDFPELMEVVASFDPAHADSLPTRALWWLRDQLGALFGLGLITEPVEASADKDPLPIPGTAETSLVGRLPEDLRGTGTSLHFGSVPFELLYLTDREAATEMSNRTVHGVAHFSWLDQGDGRFQGQMGVYVKPRGAFGRAYMAAIKPFRYWVVYPALLAQFRRTWSSRQSDRKEAGR